MKAVSHIYIFYIIYLSCFFFLQCESYNKMCLLANFSEQANNLRLMREIGLSGRLLLVMRDPRLHAATLETMATVVGLLLEGHPDPQALLK